VIRTLFQRYGRVIRFLFVGGAITLFYSLLTAGLILGPLAMPRVWASLVASLVVIPVSFAAHKRITYGDTARSAHRFTRFATLGAANLFVNVADMRLTELLHWPFWVALLAGWVIVPVVNFLLNTFWVFRARRLLALEDDALA
jgi:putative flippase GtrA